MLHQSGNLKELEVEEEKTYFNLLSQCKIVLLPFQLCLSKQNKFTSITHACLDFIIAADESVTKQINYVLLIFLIQTTVIRQNTYKAYYCISRIHEQFSRCIL